MFNSTDKYIYQHIPKFTPISKAARLTPKWMNEMIIGEDITK